MKKRFLLRQSSDILAAGIVVICFVVYIFALVSGTQNTQPETVAASMAGGVLQTETSAPSGEQASSEISQNTYQPKAESINKTNIENSSAGVNMAPDDNTPPNQSASTLAAGDSIDNPNENTTAVLAANAGEKFAIEQEAHEPVFKYVQIDTLNLRSGPSTDNEKLAELEKGTRIQVLRQADDKWLEVLTPDRLQGYVFTEYTADTKPPVYKFVSVDELNLRKGASSDAERLDTLKKGTRIQVIEVSDKWLSVQTSDDIKGYVFAECVTDQAPVVYKYINYSALNLRKGPDYETDKLAMLKAGDKVQFLETKGEWSRIKTSGNVEGYVQTKYVVNSQKLVSRAETPAETPPQPHNSDLASEVLEYAQQFVGVKYVYGGKSPKGFDCSGFTQYVFEHFDIQVPRSAAEYDGIGTKISRSDIKPGDLVLLDRYWNNELGHVGIYIGNDKIIHASSRKGKIVIASLSEYTKYSGALMGIRRVIK